MSCRTAGVLGKGHNSHGASPFLSWQIRVFRQPPCSQRMAVPFFWWFRSFLCGISPSACPRETAWYFPSTELRGIGSEEGKGACQRPVSEFIHVSILNFAAPGNSRVRKRSSAPFFCHQAGGVFQSHDSQDCGKRLYAVWILSLPAFFFTEMTFLKMLTTGDCF